MQALCHRMCTLRVSAAQAPQPLAAAKSLASKANGIAAAPKLMTIQKQQHKQPICALGLEVMCADGRRGGKLKTRKAAAKRYKVTGSGKVIVRHAGKNHFQEKKGSKRRQKLSIPMLASETHLNLIKHCLPYAGIQ